MGKYVVGDRLAGVEADENPDHVLKPEIGGGGSE
jgi:hypothetical protein